MTKFRIDYDRQGCIGAAVCEAINEKNWKMNADGKADLVGGDVKTNPETGFFTLEIEDADLQKNIEAAEACPAIIIHITNLETGEKVFPKE